MRHLFQKSPFWVYLLLFCLLGGYWWYLHIENKKESALLRMELLSLENEMFSLQSKICDRYFEKADKSIFHIGIVEKEGIKNDIDTLKKHFSALKIAFQKSPKWIEDELGDWNSTTKLIGADYTTLAVKRNLLYFHMSEIIQKKRYEKFFHLASPLPKFSIEIYSNLSAEQQLHQGKAAIFQDYENVMRVLQMITAYANTQDPPRGFEVRPAFVIDKTDWKMGEMITGALRPTMGSMNSNLIIQVNGDTINQFGGFGQYQKTYWKAGIEDLNVEFSLFNPFTGKVDRFSETFKIHVVR